MTGIDRRGDTPMGPPWPDDVLADLHAGVFDADRSDALWPQVRHDPEARAVLDALDATRAELSGLATRQAPPMPAHFAARLDAALAAEARTAFAAPPPRQPTAVRSPAQPFAPAQSPAQAQQFGLGRPFAPGQPLRGAPGQPAVAPNAPVVPVTDLARARRRRTQRWGWAAGVLVAAAAVAVVVLAVPHGNSGPVPGVAAPPPPTSVGTGNGGAPQALTGGQLDGATLTAAIGRSDYGPLTDPARRAACLTANHQNPNQTPAGALQVTLDGRPGVLMVLTTGQTARYRLLVVGPDCAAGTPDQLANTVVGGVPPTTG